MSSGRIIAISNRIPQRGAAPEGGLVVALHSALAQSGGIWVGAHPEISEAPDDRLTDMNYTDYRGLAFHLTEAQHRDYYLGFSNSVLWPVCHRRGDLVLLKREYEEAYRAVNLNLARRLAEILRPDDQVWVHDYHFFPLAAELRKLGVRARIGFFLHVPFPALGDIGALPERIDLARWLAAYDLVGLQTRADVARCLEMFRAEDEAEFMLDGTVKFGARVTALRSFPIGIDVATFEREAAQPWDSEALGPQMRGDLLIGVDRLDYSKGLPNRFRAFGRYLTERADKSRRPSLLQIAPPSRQEVDAYRQIRLELEELSGRLNGEHSELDWTPLRYIHRAIPRHLLAQLYRRAQIGLVTPFADGMNLVAKEYIAAQDPRDPGVLVLSRLAGAAEDMTEALLVNPYDIDDISEAIETALAMPLSERQNRWAACMEVVRDTDVSQWSENFLAALAARPPSLPEPKRQLSSA